MSTKNEGIAGYMLHADEIKVYNSNNFVGLCLINEKNKRLGLMIELIKYIQKEKR